MDEKKEKRIEVYNISPLGYSGIAYYDHGFCQGLHNAGIDVTNVTSDKWLVDTNKVSVSYKLKKMFINTYGDKSRIIKGLAYVAAMFKIYFDVLKNKIRIVHFQILELPIVDLMIFFLFKISGKKIVYTPHDIFSFKSKGGKFITKMLFSLSNVVVIHNEPNKKTLIEEFNLKSKKIAMIVQGNYNAFLDSALTKDQAKENVSIPKDKEMVLLFGNIREGKGTETAVKAFKLLKDKTNVLFVVAGRPMREFNMEAIKRDLSEDDVKNHVILRDQFIKDDLVESYYKSCDVLLIPYERIYNSAVIRYGFSCATTTVVSDIEEFLYFAVDKENCLIFKAGDAGDLVKKIECLLKDSALSQRISVNAKQFSDQHWSWSHAANTIKEFYERL